MTEYINQRKLLLRLMENGCPASVIDIVLNFPAVDTMLAVHGKWIFGVSEVLGTTARCSVCGWSALAVDADMWLRYPGHHFCGACGAKMDGKDEGDGQKD